MNPSASIAVAAKPRFTLPALGVRSISVQGLLLVSAAFLLPAAAHLAGLPVRVLLPMHWPVILVGLCYGWRSGVLVGLAAPGLSYLMSGMPYPAILPAMTVELASYGFLVGLSREHFRWNATVATAVTVIGGRVVFLTLAIVTGGVAGPVPSYLKAAMLPGLAIALLQVVCLPLAARWWVAREGRQ